MVTSQRRADLLALYQCLAQEMDALAVRIEDAWLDAVPDATWQMSSTAAAAAANDACAHLAGIVQAIKTTPTDS